MKTKFLIVIFFIACHAAKAQSPHLGMLVLMDSAKTGSVRYLIEMKICEPKQGTGRGDWFSHDTSTIDFRSLKNGDTSCGEYFSKGEPDLISGGNNDPVYNKFTFSNQVFAWEKIFVFRISNASSRGWVPGMFIVMPMPYKSFVTKVVLKDIPFQSGKVIYLDKLNASYERSALLIDQSLKDSKGVELKEFSGKGIL